MSIPYPSTPWVDGQTFSYTANDGSTVTGIYNSSKNAWTFSRSMADQGGGISPGGVVTTVDVKTVAQRPDDNETSPFSLDPTVINTQRDINWWLYDRTIELEEEIDDLAVTAERGVWQFKDTSLIEGEYNQIDGTGSQNLFAFTEYLTFSKFDSQGVEHDFKDVQVEDYIELKEDGYSDYGLFQITAIDEPAPGIARFQVVFAKGRGGMEPGRYARLKIFRLAQGEDLNAVADISDNSPKDPVEGQLWFNSNDDELTLYIYYDGVWVPAAPDSPNANQD